jgi:hypothetical protein
MMTKRKCEPMLSIHCWAYGLDPAEDINIDEDGQVTGANLTYESSGNPIEVLVALDTPPAEAAKFLRSAAEWVEALMEPASLKDMENELKRQESTNSANANAAIERSCKRRVTTTELAGVRSDR